MENDAKTPEELQSELEGLRRRLALVQAKFDRISEIGCGIIYILDAQGKFTFVNRAVEEILHYTPDELIGKHFSVIMPPEEFSRVGRDNVLPRLKGVVTGPEGAPKLFDERRSGDRRTKNIEVGLLTKEGKEIKVLRGDVMGIMGSEGVYAEGETLDPSTRQFHGSQGIIFDITEYKRAEQQRERLAKKLLESQKYEAVGRLAGGAAHNFNNKLGTILGYAEIIKQKYATSNPELLSCADAIIAATKQSASLTAQLLTFARKGSYQKIRINLNDTILNVCNLLTGTVQGRDIRIERNLDVHNPIVVGDPSQLQNSIFSVAMNACEAMPEGGVLTFETRIVDAEEEVLDGRAEGEERKYVQCSVVDTGIGMDEAVRSRLFEPFFTTKEVGEGAGMSLASVYGCIEKHHGYIDVVSTVGKGTTLRIHLPFAGEGTIDRSESPSKEPEPVKGKGRVLVVDDDEEICSVMKAILTDLGYSVVVSLSGEQAVTEYERQRDSIDVVLVDMVMPEVDGPTCFRRLRAIDPRVKVILTTGFSMHEEVNALLGEGAVDFITKPFDVVALSEAVYKAAHQPLQ